MEKELIECCEIMIRLLEKLYNEGKITREEYFSHIYLKKKYISDVCSNSSKQNRNNQD